MFDGLLFLFSIYYKESKKYIVVSFLEQILKASTILINIIVPKFIIDALFNGMNMEVVIKYVFILVGFNFLSSILSTYCYKTKMIENRVVMNKFLLTLSDKMTKVDFEQLESNEYKDMESKAYKFIFGNDGFGSVLRDAFSIFGKSLSFIGIVAILSTLNIFVVILFIILVMLNAYVDSKVKERNNKLNLEESKVDRKMGYFVNILQSFKFGKDIRVENAKGFIEEKYIEQLDASEQYTETRMNNIFYGKLFTNGTTLIKDIVSYGYLILQFFAKKITIGDFTMYLSAINSFSDSMIDVLNSVVNIHAFKPYYESVQAFLNLPTNIYDSGTLELKAEEYIFEFIDVSFKYKNTDHYAIKNLSLIIEPNKKYAVVGENGAGKTTFTKLLTRIYEPTSGKILVNGVNIKDIKYEEYVKIFSVVFQDFNLFSFTLAENVTLKNIDEIDEEEVKDVLIESGFENKLNKLNNGVRTYINKEFDDNGFTPSGGEAQKIAIARALYRDREVIILDEPTSALDPRAEFEIYQNFDKLVDGKTAIYISHRLSSARFCDEILVFKDGKIIEKGSHNELYSSDGLYHELYDMQAQFYV